MKKGIQEEEDKWAFISQRRHSNTCVWLTGQTCPRPLPATVSGSRRGQCPTVSACTRHGAPCRQPSPLAATRTHSPFESPLAEGAAGSPLPLPWALTQCREVSCSASHTPGLGGAARTDGKAQRMGMRGWSGKISWKENP